MENYQRYQNGCRPFLQGEEYPVAMVMCLGSTGMLCMIWRKVWHMEQFFRN